MEQRILSRRRALQAGAAVAVGTLTWTARPAGAEDEHEHGGLRVDIPGAPGASANAYEVSLGGYSAEPGTRTASSGESDQVSPWAPTSVAFCRPAGGNEELQAWAAAARKGHADARDVRVRSWGQSGAQDLVLVGCRPLALSRAGFEQGVGAIEVLTLSVADVVAGGQQHG